MAKTSKIVKNNKRLDTVNFYTEKRKDLLAIIKDPDSTYDEKRAAQKKIAKMPRDASATRHSSRDAGTMALALPNSTLPTQFLSSKLS